MGDNISELTLERYLLGEMKPGERQKIESGMNDELKARIDALRRSDEEILSTYDPAIMERAILAKSEMADGRRVLGFPGVAFKALPILAAACLAVFLVPPLFRTASIDETETTRFKGSSELQLFRQNGSSEERLDDGARARAGDVVQLAYSGGDYTFGIIVSVDGRGAVTLHYPQSESDSTELVPGITTLKDSYRLDDAPLYERFYFIRSKSSLSAAVMMDKVRNLAAAADGNAVAQLFPDCKTTSFTLVKE